MLHRLAAEESESDTPASQASTETSDLDNLDLGNKTSAMASALNSEPRPASPTNSSSSGGRRSSFRLPFRSKSNTSNPEKEKEENALVRWLRDGTVVYKSVGLGLMDLVVGMHLVNVAQEKKIGTQIAGF
jgi:hypothetical protein